MKNPFTPLRRALGQLRADLEAMYQDILTEERAFQGEPAAAADSCAEKAAPVVRRSRQPKDVPKLDLSTTPTQKRRGRPPKSPSPPPCDPEDLDGMPRPGRGRPPREPRIQGAAFEPA